MNIYQLNVTVDNEQTNFCNGSDCLMIDKRILHYMFNFVSLREADHTSEVPDIDICF